MLTTKEAFRIGFLTCCADLGLTGEQTQQVLQKAAEAVEKRAFLGAEDVKSGLGSLLRGGGTALGALAVGVPLAAGAGVGYLANEAMAPDIDDEDVKTQEIIDELRHYAARAREKQTAKTLRP